MLELYPATPPTLTAIPLVPRDTPNLQDSAGHRQDPGTGWKAEQGLERVCQELDMWRVGLLNATVRVGWRPREPQEDTAREPNTLQGARLYPTVTGTGLITCSYKYFDQKSLCFRYTQCAIISLYGWIYILVLNLAKYLQEIENVSKV